MVPVLSSLFASALYPGVGCLSLPHPLNLFFLLIICAGVRKGFATLKWMERMGGVCGERGKAGGGGWGEEEVYTPNHLEVIRLASS